MTEKKRIDVYLYENGLAESREKARALIMAGEVSIDGNMCSKASATVTPGQDVTVKQNDDFVSRGGKKLQKAIDSFGLDLNGVTAIDVGASTGGFTDCMLRSGAVYVYAVDVGYGQLAWRLRQDSRVCVMERQNARYLEPQMFDKPISFASIDVSFISLRLILPALVKILTPPFTITALIKPQFEAGRENVGKKGVVRDKNVHTDVIRGILDFAAEIGLTVCGLDYSPIKGPEGNIEYLACFCDNGESIMPDIKHTVDAAHESAN
jgi:23S rRNA (cytidine1920-2'-O)/16S rRNA (cytidine1409-2'-O)-methyltransferase